MQKEMEKKEISVKADGQKQETIWSAMLRTMRIVLLQYRIGLYIMVLLSAIIVPLRSLLQSYIEISGYHYVVTPWYVYMCGGIKMLLAVMAVIMVGNYNILSRDEISMYPGNVISRYGGTVLACHIMIVVSVLASIVGYLLQGILLTVVSYLWNSAVLGNAFSLSYLCLGAVRYLGLLLAIYAIETFWFVLTERFNLILCYVFFLVLAVGLSFLAVKGIINDELQICIDFFEGRGCSFTALIAVLFGGWAILMILSFCLAASVKVWKATDRKRLGFVVVLFYGVIIGAMWLNFGFEGRAGYSYSMDPSVFQKEVHRQMEVVADVSAWEEKNTSLLSGYEMFVKYPEKQNSSDYRSEVFASVCCSASEAKSYGLSFDESKLDKDHVILLLGTRNFTFAGRDLGEDALQAYQQSCKLVPYGGPAEWYLEYLEEHPEDKTEEEYEPDYHYETEISDSPMTLLNGFYGNLSMYMDDTTLYEEGDYWENPTNVIGAMLRIVIYPDEWDRDMVQE